MKPDLVVHFPCDGAVLNSHHGAEAEEGMTITVTGCAPPGACVTVGGVPATRMDDRFQAPYALTRLRNEIDVVCGAERRRITAVWDKASFRRYAFFIDDSIFFLTELHRNACRSLFESFYLARLRDFHARYGTRFVLNVFFRNDHEPFDLGLFSDRYRSEWSANAGWLRLAFHAFSEFPDNPYGEQFPERLPEHYAQVREQVLRFAGDATFCPPTIVHFFDVTSPAALRYLKEQGTKALAARRLPEAAGCGDAGIRYDCQSGFFRMPADLFCNRCTVLEVDRCLTELTARPGRYTINVGTHEQYSYPHYRNYLPDHFDRMETALRRVTDSGYRPVFFHEGLLGNQADWCAEPVRRTGS